MNNFIAKTCEFVKGTFADYKALKEYHYIQDDPVCVRGIWKVRAKTPNTGKFPDPLGIILYAVPIGEWQARKTALGDFFSQFESRAKRLSAINKYITYIARIIVDPRFFRLGIARTLLTESLKLQTHNLVETMTPIDWTKDMFEKAGFQHFYQPTPPAYYHMQQVFYRIGVPTEYWSNPDVVIQRIENLPRYESDLFNREAKKFLRRFRHHENETRGPDRIRYILSKIVYPNSYLLWHNPKCPSDEFVRDS